MTDFATAIQRRECGVRFFVRIQSIKYIFIDGESIKGPDGVAWTAPTAGRQYNLLPHTLDLSDGLRDTGPEISRRSSQITPGGMSINLIDNAGGDLLALFARQKSDLLAARLDADVDHTDTTITCEALTGWSASGDAHMGRECFYYPVISGADFGTGPSPVTRNIYDLTDSGGNGYGDTKYTKNVDKVGAPQVVTDTPTSWHGRWISVVAVVVGPNGFAFDSSYLETDGYQREVFRGVIKGTPKWSPTWGQVQLRAESIEAVLRTEVGREWRKGALVRFPGGAKMNEDGSANLTDQEIKTLDKKFPFVVTDDTKYLDFQVEYWALAASYPGTAPTEIYDFTGDNRLSIATGITSHGQILDRINDAITTEFDTPYGGKAAITTLNVGLENWTAFRLRIAQTSATPAYRVTMYWDTGDSVGLLLGFEGTQERHVVGLDTADYIDAKLGKVACYIGPDASQIPFWYQSTEGIATGAAPSSGYARVGEKEIVQYTSITDLQSTGQKGLYALTGCVRGRFNTSALTHQVQVNEDWTSDTELLAVEFGIGFDTATPIEAILQLAVSTGTASHHGTYDVLTEGVSPEINPLHFDTDQMSKVSDQLNELQAAIGFFTAKSHRLSELASRWLQPFGYFLAAGITDDGEYRIQVIKALPPLESEADTTIGAADLLFDDPATYEEGFSRLVNQLEVMPVWDNLKEAPDDRLRVIVNDTDSQRIYGEKGKMTLNLQGYALDTMSALGVVHLWSQALFARFGHPYELLRLRINRKGWLLVPGQTIALTLPGIPTLAGARGLSGDLAVVLQSSRTYAAPAGAGDAVGAEVLVVVEPHARNSTYSPAARVASASGATITLQANAFTPAPDADVNHFEATDEVYFVETEGDWASFDVRTILSVSGNDVVLSSAPSFTPTTSSYMVPADYDEVQASQRKHAFFADNSSPEVLNTANTEHFSYT